MKMPMMTSTSTIDAPHQIELICLNDCSSNVKFFILFLQLNMGFGQRGGFRGGRGGFNNNQGPPSEVVVAGSFVSACEGEMVCKLSNAKVPFFNAPIYLQDKTQIGKIDEILGPLNEVFFT
ncbi:H/ACA snoRNP pseudouridylase subunit, partial [Rhizopus stolonifer]